ncbi:unnamed protein product, partial [marine sediment metagenome]
QDCPEKREYVFGFLLFVKVGDLSNIQINY